MIERHYILQPEEIELVLHHLRDKQTKNGRLNLTIFRLSCCCGLRAGEIIGLNLGDVIVESACPTLTVRKATTKGKHSYGKQRTIPRDLDAGTLADLAHWHRLRTEQTGGDPDAPFVCGQSAGPRVTTMGRRLAEYQVLRRWRTALEPLPQPRRAQLSIHKGRHTFISHTLHAGYDLAEVRDFAGHAQVSTTNLYTHSLSRTSRRPDVFGFASPPQSPDQIR